MAYFSNGSEGDWYYATYCEKCIFNRKQACPIWYLHLMHNYEECNKPDSFLHVLIPRTKGGLGNEECKFFMPPSSIGLPLDEPPQTALEDHIGSLGSQSQPGREP
jgi:hypothetical protein